MSIKILVIVTLVSVLYTVAGKERCPCNSEARDEENKSLSLLLEKLSTHVKEDNDQYNKYSVYPGLLTQLACNCKDAGENENEQVVKRSVHAADRFCPKGSVRFAFTCVPVDDLVDY